MLMVMVVKVVKVVVVKVVKVVVVKVVMMGDEMRKELLQVRVV